MQLFGVAAMASHSAAGMTSFSSSSVTRVPFGATADSSATVERNPFILPSDEDVFKMRETERLKRDQVRFCSCSVLQLVGAWFPICWLESRTSNTWTHQTARLATRLTLQLRATLATQKIWEKTNYSSTMTKTRRMIDEIVPDVDPVALRKARESKGLVSAATAAISRDRRRENETLSEFVAKKREMFLVQMGLDIKREEISKMEQAAAGREEALRKSELQLAEDAVRFDAFLKDNDQQAHDALKKAEAQAKVKQEKLHDLKKLKHALGVVAAEKGKLREGLDEYKRYKSFLDSLTPEEWVQARLSEQMDLRKARKQAAYEAKLAVWEAKREEKTAEVSAKAEADRKAALRRGMQPAKVDISAVVTAQLPPPPLLDDEPLPELNEEEKELPMYFTSPHQLLEIFQQLEESNLFLIQNCQDIEQQLEELRQMHAETSAAMASQTAQLESQVAVLQAQLASEDAKAATLRRKVAAESASEAGGSASDGPGSAADASAHALDALLPALRSRIVEVYERSGFKANASSDTISMLTQLEGKLEALLAELATLEPEYVSFKEKEKEKERRIRVREARLKAQQAAHEVRQRKMLERAQAPVVKRVGKPVMFRSILPKKPAPPPPVDPEEEREREEAQFFS